MAVAEDRRRITIRLVALQVGAVVVFAALAIGFWFLQVVQNKQVRGDGGEQPPADARAAGAARRAVRPPRQGARREPPLVHHLDRPRAHQGPGPHDPPAVGGRRPRPERRAGRSSIAIAASRATGRSSSSRTRRWRRWRRSRRAASTSSCRTSSSRRCRRGSIRPTRWRRTCSATSARRATRRLATASSRARSSASRASRGSTTSC